MNNNQNYLDIMQVACDEICKHRTGLEQAEMEEKCEECPLSSKLSSILNQENMQKGEIG